MRDSKRTWELWGDDTYELLEAMHDDGMDMTGFDDHDRITPEGLPVLPMLCWLGLTIGLSWALRSIVPSWPDWAVISPAILFAHATLYGISRAKSGLIHEELRVRDLVLSFESCRWHSPKAEKDGGAPI